MFDDPLEITTVLPLVGMVKEQDQGSAGTAGSGPVMPGTHKNMCGG